MPLESKIPMVPGPEGAYNFARRKLGERLWISAPDAEFNLSDPYGYEIEWTYDSLHDKHLLPHFSKPNVIRHLLKAGFITKNLDAKCSLRDYNMYRRYLRRLHCDSIKKELNRITKQSIEEKAIQYAQHQAEKEVKRLKEKERLMELRKFAIKEIKMAERLKRQKQRAIKKKIEKRLILLELQKREAQQMRYMKSIQKAELIQQKQKAAQAIRRQKIIHTLLEWSKKERVRKKMMDLRLIQEREEKRRIVKEKWEERQEFQKKQIEKEQFLLKCLEDQRKEFIEAYEEKVRRETERMKNLFHDVRMYIRCYLARQMPSKRMRICCPKYFYNEEDDFKTDEKKLLSKSHAATKNDKTKKLTETKKKKGKEKQTNKTKLKKELKDEKKTEKKVVETQKIVKNGKQKKRKIKKKKEIKPDVKPELEEVSETISPEKVESIKSITPPSTSKDKCRCQIIKDTKKGIISQQ